LKPVNNILQIAEVYVRELYKNRSANEDLYHNIDHTLEVVEVVKKLSRLEGVSEKDEEILLIAAWFHDTGYFHCCSGHEELSSEYAKTFLDKESYPADQTEIVLNCIKATECPQNPKNKLEEIICDADLHHLGMPDMTKKSELLRREFDVKGIKKTNELEWLKISLDFITKHHFFTVSAQNEYGFQRKLNIAEIEKSIREMEENKNQIKTF
jgi:predicted metal-dependent HD superfamily phosphohydrolase